jgi:hypothetical protein
MKRSNDLQTAMEVSHLKDCLSHNLYIGSKANIIIYVLCCLKTFYYKPQNNVFLFKGRRILVRNSGRGMWMEKSSSCLKQLKKNANVKRIYF